jgi:hypothetical protein
MANEFTLRSHETSDYKRCKKKWYWKWRRGLVLKARKFGALDLGTWMHTALAAWYGEGLERNGQLSSLFLSEAEEATYHAEQAGAPEHELDKATELTALGEAVADAYQFHYANDPDVEVIQAELPLEFEITSASGKHVSMHKLKPDLVYRDRRHGGVWLMEHKTAAQIQTEHLVIDGQARPYGVMAERALRRLGLIKRSESFRGIMYNFLRKALPDERPTNDKGQHLNKDGSVSARQPGRQFLRYPLPMTRLAKLRALQTLAMDAVEIAHVTKLLRSGDVSPSALPISPDKTCPRFCDFFDLCAATEQGVNTDELVRRQFIVRDPYVYDEETADDKSAW